MPSVTRKASRTRDRRRPQIVARMMSTIEELLAEGDSYTELSVDRICTASGLPRSTFYLYFADKGELLEELAAGVVAGLLEPVRQWTGLPADASRQDIEDIHLALFERHLEHAVLLRAVVDTAVYDPRVRVRFNGLVYDAVDIIEEHISAGQAAGSVRAGIEPRVTAEWLCWMTERGLYQLVPESSPARLRELAAGLTAIIWSTLYEGTPGRPA